MHRTSYRGIALDFPQRPRGESGISDAQGLCSRAVIVTDENGIVLYTEQKSSTAHESRITKVALQ